MDQSSSIKNIQEPIASVQGHSQPSLPSEYLSRNVIQPGTFPADVNINTPGFGNPLIHTQMNYNPVPNQGCGLPGTLPHTQMPPVDLSELSFTANTGELCKGTITPYSQFNVEMDCAAMFKAMKGIGTNEAALITVAAKRSNKQRLQITTAFKTKYKKDLISELESELSFKFKKLMTALFYDLATFDAMELKEAMKGLGTNEDVLIEILCTRSNAKITRIKEEYKRLYKTDLEADVASETSFYFKTLLLNCLQGKRNELTLEQYQKLCTLGINSIIDSNTAREDAQALYKAGEGRLGTNENVFLQILAFRSIFQLRETFLEYNKIAKKTIVESIISETSGDLRKGMKVLAQRANNCPLYFAQRLHKAMKGLGTNDSTLIRIIVSRSEIDLVNIKQEFEKKYKKTLAAWIKDETSGDYRTLLLAILNEV